MLNRPEPLTYGQTARELGVSRRTIARFFERARRARALLSSFGHVPRELVDRLPVYTAGVLARIAGCSRKTVERRVKRGLLVPKRGPFAYERFSSKDVRALRASLPRRRSGTARRLSTVLAVDWRA
jgi:AraC-like DNA-binding protein